LFEAVESKLVII